MVVIVDGINVFTYNTGIIWQVQRISDQKVFHIGDRCVDFGIIDSFSIISRCVFARFIEECHSGFTQCYVAVPIDKLEKEDFLSKECLSINEVIKYIQVTATIDPCKLIAKDLGLKEYVKNKLNKNE